MDFPTFGYSNCGACYFYSSTGASGYPSTRDNKIHDLSGGNDANLGWSLTVFPDWSEDKSNCVGMGAPGCNTSTYSHLGSVLVLDVKP